jgi:hypothetical protein
MPHQCLNVTNKKIDKVQYNYVVNMVSYLTNTCIALLSSTAFTINQTYLIRESLVKIWEERRIQS